MATYIFHRLKMGKVKIDNFSMEIFGIYFVLICLLSGPIPLIWLLSKSLNLIGCQGNKREYFGEKNLLLRNHKVDEADTFHTYL